MQLCFLCPFTHLRITVDCFLPFIRGYMRCKAVKNISWTLYRLRKPPLLHTHTRIRLQITKFCRFLALDRQTVTLNRSNTCKKLNFIVQHSRDIPLYPIFEMDKGQTNSNESRRRKNHKMRDFGFSGVYPTSGFVSKPS